MSVWDPSHCQWGTEPLASKPQIQAWSSNVHVGYLQGVLRCKCGRTEIYCAPTPGPWNFDAATAFAVIDLQTMFGISPANGVVNQATWGVIDYLAVYT